MGAGLLQPGHLILILVLALILFGAGKLSDVGAALGKSVREFRQATKDMEATETGTSTGRHCPQCGTEAQPADRFCTRCGAGLGPHAAA